MFKKILVPLDGSVEAETVLPYVRDLASRFGSEVDILSVGLGSKRRRVNQLLPRSVHPVEVVARARLGQPSPLAEVH